MVWIRPFAEVLGFIIISVTLLLAVWVGFRMGRATQGADDRVKAKEFNPGPVDPVERDPYEEAMRSPEEPRRVQTMRGEEG